MEDVWIITAQGKYIGVAGNEESAMDLIQNIHYRNWNHYLKFKQEDGPRTVVQMLGEDTTDIEYCEIQVYTPFVKDW